DRPHVLLGPVVGDVVRPPAGPRPGHPVPDVVRDVQAVRGVGRGAGTSNDRWGTEAGEPVEGRGGVAQRGPLAPPGGARRGQRLEQPERGRRPLRVPALASAVAIRLEEPDGHAQVLGHDLPPLPTFFLSSPFTSALARSLSNGTVSFVPTPNPSAV